MFRLIFNVILAYFLAVFTCFCLGNQEYKNEVQTNNSSCFSIPPAGQDILEVEPENLYEFRGHKLYRIYEENNGKWYYNHSGGQRISSFLEYFLNGFRTGYDFVFLILPIFIVYLMIEFLLRREVIRSKKIKKQTNKSK